jgi:hypothetical protein
MITVGRGGKILSQQGDEFQHHTTLLTDKLPFEGKGRKGALNCLSDKEVSLEKCQIGPEQKRHLRHSIDFQNLCLAGLESGSSVGHQMSYEGLIIAPSYSKFQFASSGEVSAEL